MAYNKRMHNIYSLGRKQNGFHVAKMVPYEVISFGIILALTPFVGFIVAIINALIAIAVYHYVVKSFFSLARAIPTALGYSDLATNKTKKAAAKVNAVTKTQKLAQKTA